MKFLENGTRPQPPTSPSMSLFELVLSLLTHVFDTSVSDTYVYINIIRYTYVSYTDVYAYTL